MPDQREKGRTPPFGVYCVLAKAHMTSHGLFYKERSRGFRSGDFMGFGTRFEISWEIGNKAHLLGPEK